MENKFWKNKIVLITGNTGFKGSWLSLWLSLLGAKVFGYSLEPPTNPSIYYLANIKEYLELQTIGDIRDYIRITKFMKKVKPDIIFHMAAQSSS